MERGVVLDAVCDRMRCPACGGRLTRSEHGVGCSDGHSYASRDGYFDLSAGHSDAVTAQTFESFGYEWSSFGDIREEDESFWLRYVADLPLEELRGAVALDAGCGKGRYTRLAARHVGAMVALDGSDAIVVAARHLAPEPNVVCVRADLRSAPFAPGSFDFVSCLGVLHHLEDPQEGLRALVRLLTPGGLMLLYVYSGAEQDRVRAAGLQAAGWLRRLTVRMPHAVLRVVASPLASLLYLTLVLPGLAGDRLGIGPLARLPLATYRGQPLRSLWLDTFDRLSAPVEWRFDRADIEQMCESADLKIDALRQEAGFFIVGRRSPRQV